MRAHIAVAHSAKVPTDSSMVVGVIAAYRKICALCRDLHSREREDIDVATLMQECEVLECHTGVTHRNASLKLRRKSDSAIIMLAGCWNEEDGWYIDTSVTLPSSLSEGVESYSSDVGGAIADAVFEEKLNEPVLLSGERDVELDRDAKDLWVTVGGISVFINASNEDSVTVQLFPRKDEMGEPLDEAYATFTDAAARAATT